MAAQPKQKPNLTKCSNCPLRPRARFRDFDPAEAKYVSSFKTGELSVDAGATVLVEGASSAHLFTVLEGWAFRYKTLEDGRRQIMNYVLPGDMIGLQGTISGEMEHSIETLTDVTLCVFERDRIMELFKNFPHLAYDMTWIAAREEVILEEHLLSVGRRTAIERAAYLLAFLSHRSNQHFGRGKSNNAVVPIPQQHVADTLGLSIVHTNKTLKKLASRGLIKWLDKGCEVKDINGLCKIAVWEPDFKDARPFI